MAQWFVDISGAEAAAAPSRPVSASSRSENNASESVHNINAARPDMESDEPLVTGDIAHGNVTVSPLFDSASWLDWCFDESTPVDAFCPTQTARESQPAKQAPNPRNGNLQPRDSQASCNEACRTLVQDCLRFVRSVLTSDPAWCESASC
jgi:hypothetical protein